VPDHEGAKLVWEWISSMTPTPSVNDNGDRSARRSESEATDAYVMPAHPATSELLLLWHRLASMSPGEAQSVVSEQLRMTAESQNQQQYVRGLFEPWISPSERSLLVGHKPDVAELIRLIGDPNRGRAWFADAGGSQCRACHRIGALGSALGPDLDDIASRMDRTQVLRSLISPSETIDPRWKTHTILMNDGAIISGLLVSESEDEIVLKTNAGNIHRVSRHDVDAISQSTQSMMPDGQIASMTPQQVADLVAFVMESKSLTSNLSEK